jgi:hypothetical protein
MGLLLLGCSAEPTSVVDEVAFAVTSLTADSIGVALTNNGTAAITVSPCYVERETRSAAGEWAHHSWIGDPDCETILEVGIAPGATWEQRFGWVPDDAPSRLRFRIGAETGSRPSPHVAAFVTPQIVE